MLNNRRLELIAQGEAILKRAEDIPELQSAFTKELEKVKFAVELLKGININDTIND